MTMLPGMLCRESEHVHKSLIIELGFTSPCHAVSQSEGAGGGVISICRQRGSLRHVCQHMNWSFTIYLVGELVGQGITQSLNHSFTHEM